MPLMSIHDDTPNSITPTTRIAARDLLDNTTVLLTDGSKWVQDPQIALMGNQHALAVWTETNLTLAEAQAITSLDQVLNQFDLASSE